MAFRVDRCLWLVSVAQARWSLDGWSHVRCAVTGGSENNHLDRLSSRHVTLPFRIPPPTVVDFNMSGGWNTIESGKPRPLPYTYHMLMRTPSYRRRPFAYQSYTIPLPAH